MILRGKVCVGWEHVQMNRRTSVTEFELIRICNSPSPSGSDLANSVRYTDLSFSLHFFYDQGNDAE